MGNECWKDHYDTTAEGHRPTRVYRIVCSAQPDDPVLLSDFIQAYPGGSGTAEASRHARPRSRTTDCDRRTDGHLLRH